MNIFTTKMGYWVGHKRGYYSAQGFESHMGGFTSRAQAKWVAKLIVVLFVLLAVTMPMAVKADESDMMVAVKFQYNFGEPVRKSELRMGMFTADMDDTPSLDFGLLELRVQLNGDATPYLLERNVDVGLAQWGVSQLDRIKELLGRD